MLINTTTNVKENKLKDNDECAQILLGSVLGINISQKEEEEAGSDRKGRSGCDAVSVKASYNKMESSEAGMALQSCPELGQGRQAFVLYPHIDQ